MQEKKLQLLVIDDDDINIFIIRKIVEKTGVPIEMVSRNNGQQAIDYLKDAIASQLDLPQLVLIDINMPVMNGWEFIEAYQDLNIEQPVNMYILSSSVYENDIEKTKTYPLVKGFISKPLSMERLNELINLLK
ncbi:MAG: response regulator [Pedobacter sp.]|nr:MAG: response regulator [Pedobacter sp.]